MTPRSGSRGGDSAMWAAAGAMVVLAVALVLWVQPHARAEPLDPAEARPPALGAAAPEDGASLRRVAPPVSDDGGRAAEFVSRMTAFQKVERLLRTAFAPPGVEVARARPARGARVAPGETPTDCLAQAVYYEARGEPADGQAAVAQVVLNRTRSGRHPSDVCGVVFEGAARPGCQFSFACDRRLGLRPPEPDAWRRSRAVAASVLGGAGRADLDGAVNYHADWVHPRWAAGLAKTAEIGRHIFYSASRAAAAAAGWSFAPPAERAGA